MNNILTVPFCFVVLDKLYCNLYATCKFRELNQVTITQRYKINVYVDFEGSLTANREDNIYYGNSVCYEIG